MARQYVSSADAAVQALMEAQLALLDDIPLVADVDDLRPAVDPVPAPAMELPIANPPMNDDVGLVPQPAVDMDVDENPIQPGDVELARLAQAVPTVRLSPAPRLDSNASEELHCAGSAMEFNDLPSSPSQDEPYVIIKPDSILHCAVCNEDEDSISWTRCGTCKLMFHEECVDGDFDKMFICLSCESKYDEAGFDVEDVMAYGEILDAGISAMANKARQLVRDKQIGRRACLNLCNTSTIMQVVESLIGDLPAEDEDEEMPIPPIPVLRRRRQNERVDDENVDSDGEVEEAIPIRSPHNRPFDDAAIDEAIDPAGMDPVEIARARELLQHLEPPQDEAVEIGE